MQFYGEICRVDEEQRMVWGYASTTTRAEDGQVIAIEALEDALDEYMRFANIREMHQQVAVGVAREASVDDKGMYLGAHIVDEDAWLKVKAGVYKGFSIKGPVTQRDAMDRTVVRGLKIYEISLVDRPSDPDAVFDVWRSPDANAPDLPLNVEAAEAAQETVMKRPANRGAPANAPAPEETVERAADPSTEGAAVEDQAQAPAGGEPEPDPPAEGEGAEQEAAPEGEDQAPEAEEAAAEPVARAAEAAGAAIARLDAAVADLERAAEPVVLPELPGAELRRSISTVGRLGYLISEFAYLIHEADYEAEAEGDNSPVPEQLREALRALATAYRAMSAEEINELLASLNATSPVERSPFVAQPAQEGDEIQRGADSVGGDLAASHEELVQRVAALTEDRDVLLRSVGDLTAKVGSVAETVERLGKAVLPSKTAGVLVRAVDKGDDAAGAAPEDKAPAEPTVEDVKRSLDAMSEQERADLLIRSALARPMPIGR